LLKKDTSNFDPSPGWESSNKKGISKTGHPIKKIIFKEGYLKLLGRSGNFLSLEIKLNKIELSYSISKLDF